MIFFAEKYFLIRFCIGCNVEVSKSAATKSRELVDYATVGHETDEHLSDSLNSPESADFRKSDVADFLKSETKAADLTIQKLEAGRGRKDDRTPKNNHDYDDVESNENTQGIHSSYRNSE